ncbi:LuxR C-terminal-related transcriptional regulator [Kitasatospora sp. NPDC086009]|uniref:helix-turn-helix transcriptional regulator n=1 Tax=unclassified Kitasatospora TaxID=2633591 RepID=UPI0036E6D83A
MLEKLGLGAEAGSVYKEMLKDPQSGPADIAGRLGWTEARVRSSLDELARLALLRPSWQDPGVLKPVEPEVGLRYLLDRREAELQRRLLEIEQGRRDLVEVVAEYANLTRSSRTSADVEVLEGIDSIRLRIESLATGCTEEVLGFVTSGVMSEANIEASRPLDLRVLRGGVRLRSIYLESIKNDNNTIAYAHWLTEQGAQVRVAPTLPPRMVIYDRSTAIVPVDPEETRRGALVLRGHGVVGALCELFERVWQSSLPVASEPEAPVGREQPELSPRSQAILVLLAKGATDEMIARRLGVSVRTVRRGTAELAAQLGAKTKFQAGMMALQHGWVDPALLS